jgi:hypothetical protein
MLSDDIERVRRALEIFYSKKGEVWVSFGRIKTALAESTNSSHNNASTKLLARLHQMVLQSPLVAGYAMSDLIKEVREQLRASGE